MQKLNSQNVLTKERQSRMGDDSKMAVRAVETGERKDRVLIVEDEDNARKGYEQLLLAIKDLSFGRIDLVVNNVPVLAYNMSRAGTGGKPLAITDTTLAG